MKILIIGYGKMGKTIEKIAVQKGHEIVAIIDVNNVNEISNKLNLAEVAIEFSAPEAAYYNIMSCISAKVPVISGTTGWLAKYEQVTNEVIKQNTAFFYASNYSIGVNIFFELNRYLAKIMNDFNEYDVLTEEIHHTEKKDSPSGTAITIAEEILNNIDRKKSWKENEICTNDKISIYSKRIGNIFGIHEVQYHNEIERIKLSHEAFGREGFALGALAAAQWIIGKKGVFGMQDMLGLDQK